MRRLRAASTRRWMVILAGGALAVSVAFYVFSHVTLETLIHRERELRDRLGFEPAKCYAAASVLYVAVAAFSLPIATVLTLVYAWLFGFWPAALLVSFASTAGATLAFLSSRYLLRDWVQERFGTRLAGFNEALAHDGAFFLFTLRLVWIVPFWLVNLLMGLTSIRTWTFWWVSQLGMLPVTCIYVWTGANLPSLERLAQHGAAGLVDWKLITALAALGAFPWIARAILRRVEKRREM